MATIEAIQAAGRDADVDGWRIYVFRRSNQIAHRVLGLPEGAFFSRRWVYYIPATGEPSALVSAVESHLVAGLPGQQGVFRTWQELPAGIAEMVRGARRVAMEYSPENANPYVAKVDAGTVELVRSFGAEVVSSGDFAQQFEAVLTPAQLESHRAAGRALLRARDGIFAWLRTPLPADPALGQG